MRTEKVGPFLTLSFSASTNAGERGNRLFVAEYFDESGDFVGGWGFLPAEVDKF
jgi:hypothetical protein